MSNNTRFVGMDVHSETIAIAVAEADGSVRSVGIIPNRLDSIRKALKKLGPKGDLRVCYEAGPTGYVLYWQLTTMGVACKVVAPTLVPVKPGDRVKTDRRDAKKLARSYRSGDLTAVWVPDQGHEALRDLVRARETAKADQRRARHRLQKFLLRHGLRRPSGTTAWGVKHHEWIGQVKFDIVALDVTKQDYLHEVDHQTQRIERLERSIDEAVEAAPAEVRDVIAALQALRGVAKTTAVGVAAEVGEFSRFEHPRQLMGYSGSVPSEHSTGGPGKARRGAITKTGNAHLRRLITEAAWAYRHHARVGWALGKRQEGLPAEVLEISWRAQVRLCGRYRRLTRRGKEKQKVVTAIGRELLGFMWAIAAQIETAHQSSDLRVAA